MGVLKSILLIVYLIPIGSMAQFRIVGLLNVEDSKPNGNSVSTYQSNAQGRGFSIDEGLKKFLIRPKNIIRVHLIDDVQPSDLIPETDNILMIRRQKPKVKPPIGSVHSASNVITKIPSKSEKLFYRTKRPQQRPAFQLTNKYQHKFNSVIPESANRSPVHSPVQSTKRHKAIKRNNYKSRCRCERISNCPRIQISVTRCEPNYFLCCF
ncbi:uncharacterized protein LOC129566113 [Sitodiplosis mosellana]|uniref:uncharacterized protein LOC129566113 n=1 Tax=Sitodiplosis mosellana TaxID=263140 RepID=UPI00244487E5|nr:uncharacterized protein LOC129566113 [Sitodiplosis mosellana]